MLSTRIRKFHTIVRAAYDQSSWWLIEAARDKTTPPLSRLACLRVLVCRVRPGAAGYGLPYPQRKRLVRNSVGI